MRKTARQFKEAAEDLQKYLQLKPNDEDDSIWREQLEALRIYAEPAEKPDAERTVFSVAEVTIKPRVLAKPEPSYTESAREAQIEGTVVLRALFASDGTVSHVLILNSLPKGLTQQAIKAAQKIKFIPATINGRSVSTFMMLEYNFNLY
jgi:TonB family protein